MADTLPNVVLPIGQWVDLYTSTGLATGTQIQVQNVGGVDIRLVTQAGEPTDQSGYNILRPFSLTFISQAAPTGAWARADTAGGVVNVGEVA